MKKTGKMIVCLIVLIVLLGVLILDPDESGGNRPDGRDRHH